MNSKRQVMGASFIILLGVSASKSWAHEDAARGRLTAEPRPWTFVDCVKEGVASDKAVSPGVSATVEYGAKGFLKERKIGVELKLGAKHLQFDFYPNHPPSGQSGRPTHIWTSRAQVQINGKTEPLSVVYEERQLASGPEKIFVVPTKANQSSYDSKLRQYTVAMFTDSGKFVEAEINAVGKEFLTIRILQTCGGGFGLSEKLGKGFIKVDPRFRTPSAERGELNLDRPTVTASGNAYSQNETWLLQELLDRVAAR